jgi:hypothetical protein
MNGEDQHIKFAKAFKVIILIVLSIPLCFQLLNKSFFTPLNGVQTSKAVHLKDSFKGNFSFLNRTLQQYLEAEIEENLIVKSPLVRLRNQYEYSFFQKLNAQQIYQYGDQLFRFYDPTYNEASLFLGKNKIEAKIKKLTEIQAYLGKEHPIITLIAPSKTYFYSEYLPEIHRYQTESSNYKAIKKELKKKQLTVIDFNQWFLKLKGKTTAPLFGKSGIHWSSYGATLAMDSLVSYLENKKQSQFQHANWKLNSAYEFLYNDHDLGQLLNVFFPPNDLSLRNPIFIQPKHPKKKIKALIISDSFFDVISITKLRSQIFTSDSDYLYYFNTRKDQTNNNQSIDKNELLSKMKECDCIILLNDIVNMEDFGWGFIETAYEQVRQPSIRH